MTISTGEVAISDIALELGRAHGGNTNISLADWSGKLWKGGPSVYATFKENRVYGSNCEASVPVAAQGGTLRDQSDPWLENTDANVGLNAPGYGISEWKGYNHNGYDQTTTGRSTLGVKPLSTAGLDPGAPVVVTWPRLPDPNASASPPITSDVVAHAGHQEVEVTFDEVNDVDSTAGLQIYCYKPNAYTVAIVAKEGLSPWDVGNSSTSGFDLAVLGGNNGADQTAAANYSGGATTVTLMNITGANRITGCGMSLETQMPTFGPLVHDVADPDTNNNYGGAKVRTVTGGYTSTTNLGATVLIGYDLCCGGQFRIEGLSSAGVFESCIRTYGVEFNFIATNNDNVVFDTNPGGPTYNGVDYKSFKVTVYASLYAEAITVRNEY